jgi:hypothetical protein
VKRATVRSEEKAEPFRDQIVDWMDRCRGNLVRVHEAAQEMQHDTSPHRAAIAGVEQRTACVAR